MTSSIHLGFDMGIRNLAYCLVEHYANNTWKIIAWDNIDLLEGGTSAQVAKKCIACSGAAKWINEINDTKWCNACATQTRIKKSATQKPTLPVLPFSTLTIKPLRALASSMNASDIDSKKAKKEDYIVWVKKHYLVPWKPTKAMDVSLFHIRRAMNRWLDSMLSIFSKATLIRLENQPVMKGPTMKSVQIILFTLLGHRLETEYTWSGSIEFVHAGTKTKHLTASGSDVKEGDAYRDRKKSAEQETIDKLTSTANTEWLSFFTKRTKKSDLADAFLMALRSSV